MPTKRKTSGRSTGTASRDRHRATRAAETRPRVSEVPPREYDAQTNNMCVIGSGWVTYHLSDGTFAEGYTGEFDSYRAIWKDGAYNETPVLDAHGHLVPGYDGPEVAWLE